jgi:hypothetical protein
MALLCEYGNEFSDSVKNLWFLGELRDNRLSTMKGQPFTGPLMIRNFNARGVNKEELQPRNLQIK